LHSFNLIFNTNLKLVILNYYFSVCQLSRDREAMNIQIYLIRISAGIVTQKCFSQKINALMQNKLITQKKSDYTLKFHVTT
jgi:hypothetical protein